MAKLEGKDNKGKIRKIKRSVLNDGPPDKPVKPGGHEVSLIDTPEYQAIIEKVYEYLRDGYRSNEIFAMLTVDFEDLTANKFETILTYAYKYAEICMHKDREYMFQLHMERYEKTYFDCLNLVNSWNQPLDPKKDWHIIVAKYTTALKALEQKEKLLGLHDKNIVIEFNDQKAVVVEQETLRGRHIDGIDIERLALDEKVELLKLIQETRTVPIEGIQRVIIKQTKIEINPDTLNRNVLQKTQHVDAQNIEFEEMPDNVVDKMQEQVKVVEEEITSGPVVVDEVGNVIGKNLSDVKKMIANSNIELFKEALKKKKGV